MFRFRLAPHAFRQTKIGQQPVNKAHEFNYTWLSIIVALLLASPASAAVRDKVTALYSQQAQVKSISEAGISPDGTQVAWSVYDAPTGAHAIYLAHLSSPSVVTRISAGAAGKFCNESEPVWSHSGKQIAFLSDCATSGQSQLFIEDFTGHGARQLTHFSGFVSQLRWSPDDRQIALLYVDHSTRAPTPMAAENKAVGVIDDLANTDVQRISVTDTGRGETRSVTPAGLYVFEFDWSPDGQSFAYTAALPPGDDNWYIAKLYTQPCARPEPKPIYQPRWQLALPRWSPDGKTIAFIEGLMSDEGGTGGEIYTVRATGGPLRDLTPGRASSAAWFSWLSPNKMLFTEFVGGSSSIGTLDVPTTTAKALWSGSETIRAGSQETSLSVAAQSGTPRVALIRTSWSMLPELWAGPVGKWEQVTHLNSKVDLALPKFENVRWTNGGFDVQGWLLFPQNYDPAKRYPMLVTVHGGPAWIATPTWRAPDFDTTLFTNFSYFVFFPNARGSYGQGENFTQANRRDWGFGDLSDMLAGVDSVLKRYPIDSRRVGILGWSYGGSTAMMAITQTNRFRAAVAGAGAGNWQSYYGQNSIDKWMIPYFGASVYDDPAAYARCSALSYIKNAKTPTLVLVGERDGEAPPAQSIEFWHALKELGVPTRLVIYPGEGHDFNRTSDEIDVTVRTLEWFAAHMPE
ncbi:MAG TPA: S9 family peptidase [Bryobacteraceae bacterium]|nr:S9 family peptidase [Bryobacteraceae bacterium]